MREFLYRLLLFTKNTTVRVISLLLVLCLIGGYFIYPRFYKKQWYKIQSYYYVYKGDKAYKKNLKEEAIKNYTHALELHPKHIRARYNLANLYVVYEDYYSALENYEQALILKPDFMVARIDYAIVLTTATYNYDKAIDEYELAVKNKPKKWIYIPYIIDSKKNYNYNKGVAYYNQGVAWRNKSILAGKDKFESRKYLLNAVESYQNALKTLKEYDVYYNLGIVNQILKRNHEAGKNYCKAIEKEPLNYEAHYNLAILLRSMDNYIASWEEFKKAGLLISGNNDANKTRYVYDVLNEVSQKIALEPEYKDMMEELSDENFNKGKVSWINGKLIISEEFDKAMNDNFRTCADKEYFEAAETGEND